MLRRGRHGAARCMVTACRLTAGCVQSVHRRVASTVGSSTPLSSSDATARQRGGAIPPGTLRKPTQHKGGHPQTAAPPPPAAPAAMSPLEAYFFASEASDDGAVAGTTQHEGPAIAQTGRHGRNDADRAQSPRGVLVNANDGARDLSAAAAASLTPTDAYRMQDPQDRFHVSDPHADGMMLDLMGASDEDTLQQAVPLAAPTLAALYRREGAQALWAICHSQHKTATAPHVGGEAASPGPPAWLESVCRHLYFRTSEDQPQSSTGDISTGDMGAMAAPAQEAVDPFLWIDFNLFDQDKYLVGPYTFQSSTAAWYSEDTRAKLCLGDVLREYVCFAEGYCFPDRRQLPTSLGTQPIRLLFDPRQATPTVLIQLSPEMPPMMWLPVKPSAAAIRRVVSEFAAAAAMHRDGHHAVWEQRWDQSKRTLEVQRMRTSDADVLRMVGYAARDVTYGEAPVREFPNSQEFFLGEYDDPERLMEYFDLCPYLFAVPLMRTVADVHSKEYVPRIDGPGLAMSLYRCVFSKALLLVQVHLSAEVKLPPQDPEAFAFLWRDSEQLPKSKIPVFVRVVWPDNQRMCGGGRVVERFNDAFGTEFSRDIPVDACMAVWSLMGWAKQSHELLGVLGMRQRLAAVEAAAASSGGTPLLYPGTREIPNPEYTDDERLGMHIQYLAHLRDPQARDTLLRLWGSGSAPVRMGCAKAALELGDRALFREIVSSEPPGRMQTYMVKLVRKRKARDLTDAVPRLMDDQYEFSAPLWTKRRGNPMSLGGGGGAK